MPTLFMVHYLQEVQGPRYVVGRVFVTIAASPDARRMFLSTAKHLLLQARFRVQGFAQCWTASPTWSLRFGTDGTHFGMECRCEPADG